MSIMKEDRESDLIAMTLEDFFGSTVYCRKYKPKNI